MSASCGHHNNFEGQSPEFIRRLWLVIIINASMFFIEISAGYTSHSKALQVDALDFIADAFTYGISLFVIGKAQRVRSSAALVKGLSLFVMGIFVMGSTIYNMFEGVVPDAPTMGLIGALALAANVVSVLLLVRFKDGDANIRSVWLCSRNDAVGNVIVMIAATGVWNMQSGWPDLGVAFIMGGLFLSSSYQILQQAREEFKRSSVRK